MRHRNAISNSYFHGRGRHINSPYNQEYKFTRISAERRYVQVMKYILEHPNCKRFDILCGVFGILKRKPGVKYSSWLEYLGRAKFSSRGHMSNLFSNMLYHDLIDYNNKFEYNVTEKGREILRKAGITEIQMLVTVRV